MFVLCYEVLLFPCLSMNRARLSICVCLYIHTYTHMHAYVYFIYISIYIHIYISRKPLSHIIFQSKPKYHRVHSFSPFQWATWPHLLLWSIPLNVSNFPQVITTHPYMDADLTTFGLSVLFCEQVAFLILPRLWYYTPAHQSFALFLSPHLHGGE